METRIQNIKYLSAFLFIGLLLIFSSQVKAQGSITFKGRIVDSQTNEPLPFATIMIFQLQTNVISNEFGEFQYHIPENSQGLEVQITYLGYKTFKIKVSEIKSGILTIVKMETQREQIQEVEVISKKSKTEAIDIVDKAIGNIRKNYPRDKTLLHGYYRDYISPTWTHNYINLFEAALVIEDRGFQSDDFHRSKIQLEQLRYNPEIAIDSSLMIAYDGKNKFIPNASNINANELAVLRAHDPIRNHKIPSFSFIDVFDYNFTQGHHFHFESITEEDSVILYGIRFDKRVIKSEPPSEYLVDGQIFISSKSYAILKFNYTITCNTPTYAGKFMEVKLEYKNFNDQYYLNYLSLMNYFIFKNNTPANGLNPTNIPFFQYRELFINKVENEPFEALQASQVIRKDASLLINKVSQKEGFWESYNYMGISKLLESN